MNKEGDQIQLSESLLFYQSFKLAQHSFCRCELATCQVTKELRLPCIIFHSRLSGLPWTSYSFWSRYTRKWVGRSKKTCMLYSKLQGISLHGSFFVGNPSHGDPPFWAGVCILDPLLVPIPHVLVHGAQVQLDQWQSTENISKELLYISCLIGKWHHRFQGFRPPCSDSETAF